MNIFKKRFIIQILKLSNLQNFVENDATYSFYVGSKVKHQPHLSTLSYDLAWYIILYFCMFDPVTYHIHVCLGNGLNAKPGQTLLRWKWEKKNYGSFASRGIITKRTVRIANHPPIKGDISPWYHRKISISNNRSPHFHVQRERKLGGPDTHAGKKYIKIKRFLCTDEITLNHR